MRKAVTTTAFVIGYVITNSLLPAPADRDHRGPEGGLQGLHLDLTSKLMLPADIPVDAIGGKATHLGEASHEN